MAVHPQSVISPIVDDNALYVALTDREDYTYKLDLNGNANPKGFTDYSPYWTTVNSAIVAHYAQPRALDSFIEALYSDIVISGTTPSVATYGAHLLQLNGVRAFVLGTTVGFYADLPLSGAPTTPPPTAANLDALALDISTAFAAETVLYASLQAGCVGRSRAFVHRQLFEDVPITVTRTKPELGNLIYGSGTGELGYKAASLIRNIGSAAPSYVP